MAKNKNRKFLPSTGNSKADTVITIAVVGAVAYIGYKLVKIIATPQRVQNFSNLFEDPVGQLPSTPTDMNIFERKKICKLMDDIHNEILGVNFTYEPVVINRILPYNCADLSYANDYYYKTYGESLLDAINGEWDFYYYTGAREKLIGCGLDLYY